MKYKIVADGSAGYTAYVKRFYLFWVDIDSSHSYYSIEAAEDAIAKHYKEFKNGRKNRHGDLIGQEMKKLDFTDSDLIMHNLKMAGEEGRNEKDEK